MAQRAVHVQRHASVPPAHDEWVATATSPDAVAACARWRAACPVLDGLASPADVVAECNRRGDPARSAAVLRAVLSQVGEGPWPARTVLQAVLPGLAAVVRRAMPQVGPHRSWRRAEELDQHAVGLAYERITALAADPRDGRRRPSSTAPGSACGWPPEPTAGGPSDTG